MLCSDRHSRASYFSLTLFLSFARVFFFTSLSRFYLLSCCLLVAPGPAAVRINLLMQQHTYLISLSLSCTLSLTRFSLSHTQLSPYSLLTSTRAHTTLIFFYMCVCLCFSISGFSPLLLRVFLFSFIDYLNVTTKLDISTSSNKLGFVCLFFKCVFFPLF